MYLCQAPGGMVARESGCDHRFSPKLRQPGLQITVAHRTLANQNLLMSDEIPSVDSNAMSECNNPIDVR